DSHVGQHARLMSQALRKLAGAINKSNTIIIFINQLREKIGVMYGNPETTTGGRALKFYASMRMDVRKAETIKGANGEFVGSRTRVKIVKNKVAPPFKEAEFDIIYGEGISKVGEILDIAVAMDVIHKSGAWFSYGDSRLGQGRENVKELLKNDPALCEEIKNKIYADKDAMLRACKSGSKKGAKGKAAAKASDDSAPAAEPASAKAKLDIAVDDD
ncbi:MAG TPA: DNA recombination/repair protein RecA, partial [Ruminococcaceae bacterium]|nr:DNA recombination/repair protein RecA [Oscillospiraceae bacterium]